MKEVPIEGERSGGPLAAGTEIPAPVVGEPAAPIRVEESIECPCARCGHTVETLRRLTDENARLSAELLERRVLYKHTLAEVARLRAEIERPFFPDPVAAKIAGLTEEREYFKAELWQARAALRLALPLLDILRTYLTGAYVYPGTEREQQTHDATVVALGSARAALGESRETND